MSGMIQQYCRRLHRGAVICEECQSLVNYIEQKIALCRSGKQKSACLQCTNTCLSDAQRLKLKHVMTWSVDRVGWKEPTMMIKYHWLSACRRRNAKRPSVVV